MVCFISLTQLFVRTSIKKTKKNMKFYSLSAISLRRDSKRPSWCSSSIISFRWDSRQASRSSSSVSTFEKDSWRASQWAPLGVLCNSSSKRACALVWTLLFGIIFWTLVSIPNFLINLHESLQSDLKGLAKHRSQRKEANLENTWQAHMTFDKIMRNSWLTLFCL